MFILIQSSLNLDIKIQIENTTTLIWALAWRRKYDQPLCKPMMVQLVDAYLRH